MSVSISIILPVYNSEAYVDETLASVKREIEQGPNYDWQVIAVDDGSTDKSLEILSDWSHRLPLTVVKLTHSGSPAGPRNYGIEISTGDYIFFLDSDDLLLPGGISTAVEFAVKNDSDVVLPRLKSLDGRGVPRGMFSGNRDQVTLADSRVYWALNPMKLIRRSLLTENNIRFEHDLSVGEDQPFSAKCYLNAEKVSILSSPPVVGVRYTKTKSNISLKAKPASAYFELLENMAAILTSSNLSTETMNFLWIRHWEIEVSRELVWNTLPVLGDSPRGDLVQLHELTIKYLKPAMLPRTSIRWRGIVGLIATENYSSLETLIKGRQQVIENKSFISKVHGLLISNWIRLKATIRLLKAFY
jgi:glycosyltransferase involved in cell wall biosynthesis